MKKLRKIEESQKCNVLISKDVKIKQLNVDKSGLILFGNQKKVNELQQTIETQKNLAIDICPVKVKANI